MTQNLNESVGIVTEGKSHAKLGKHKDAIVLFDSVLKDNPKNGTVIYSKARSKAELGEDLEAMQLLAQAIVYYGKTIKGWAVKDSAFDRLKNDLRFKAVVK